MTTKITVSLPDELVEVARASVARDEFASVSAYVADAIRRAHSGFTLTDVLDQIEAEVGPPTPEQEAWADRVLGLGSRT